MISIWAKYISLLTSKASEKSVESPAAGSIWHDFARILAAQCPPGIYGPVQRAFTKISSSGVRGVLLLLARGTPVSAARCARPQTPPVFDFDGPSAPLPAKGLGKGRAPARCLFSGKSCQLSERIRIGGSSSCSLWHSLAQSKNAAALAGGRGRLQRTFPPCGRTSTAPKVAPAPPASGGQKQAFRSCAQLLLRCECLQPAMRHPKRPCLLNAGLQLHRQARSRMIGGGVRLQLQPAVAPLPLQRLSPTR